MIVSASMLCPIATLPGDRACCTALVRRPGSAVRSITAPVFRILHVPNKNYESPDPSTMYFSPPQSFDLLLVYSSSLIGLVRLRWDPAGLRSSPCITFALFVCFALSFQPLRRHFGDALHCLVRSRLPNTRILLLLLGEGGCSALTWLERCRLRS